MNGVTISGFDSSMNFSGVMTTSSSSGPGGDITVITPNLSLDNGGIISTTTLADGQGGNILLNVGTLNVTGGAQITSNTGTFDPDTGEPIGSGNGGDITVTATNSVLVSGGNLDIFALSNISSNTFASGSGGTIRIIAPNVTLAGAGSITSSSLGDGAGGNVSIIASNLLSASGFSDDFGMATSIVSSASGSGAGGAIVISAPAAKVDDRAAILTSTFGSGSAGDLTLQVGSLSVTGGASITTTGELGSSGKLTITAQDNVSISGQFDSQTPSLLSNDVSSPGGFGGTNNGITISAGTFALTNGGRIESRTVVSGNEQVSISARDTIMVSGSKIQAFTSGGEVSPLQFSAPTITLNQATITSSTASNQNAGAINFTAGNVNLSGGSSIRSDTQQGSGQGGSIVVTASDSILLSQGSTIQSNTTTLLGGSAGSVTVNAGNLVSLSGSGSTITSTTSGSGGGGSIQVQAGSLQLSDGALISAASTGTGNAGTVNIQTGGNFVMNGGIVSTSATQATGGNITVNAGQQVQMNSGALISASSSGPGNAGDIAVSAGDSILLNASTIKTEATQADGGNITLTAPNTIHLTNSTVSSSVGGGVTTVGGNITIDPQFLILQNSQIIAQAFEGQGGNINITAGVFLADPNSVVSASSQKGINGSVVIQSPIANLSQIIAPLQKSTLQATAFLLERCAVRAQSGTLSSLTVRARDVAPAAPGGMLSGPLLSLGPSPGASGASRPAVQESVVPKPPLLEVSGELFRRMDGRLEGQLVGCGS
jgi:large exoprotein involved in heme utilization and adhesion